MSPTIGELVKRLRSGDRDYLRDEAADALQALELRETALELVHAAKFFRDEEVLPDNLNDILCCACAIIYRDDPESAIRARSNGAQVERSDDSDVTASPISQEGSIEPATLSDDAVVSSSGCVFCDLELARFYMLTTPMHDTQNGPVRCTLFEASATADSPPSGETEAPRG